LLARTMMAPPFSGNRCMRSASLQWDVGGGNISLTMMALSGTGVSVFSSSPSARFAFIQPIMSGEYQTTAGACVP
jgi:hypothetical protein